MYGARSSPVLASTAAAKGNQQPRNIRQIMRRIGQKRQGSGDPARRALDNDLNGAQPDRPLKSGAKTGGRLTVVVMRHGSGFPDQGSLQQQGS